MSQMETQAGPPPGLLAMLQGGGTPQDAPASDEREPIAILKQMIELAQRYMQVEPDAEDKATMAKLHATLQQYMAKDQADAEAALGGGPATRLMRKLGQ